MRPKDMQPIPVPEEIRKLFTDAFQNMDKGPINKFLKDMQEWTKPGLRPSDKRLIR